MVAEFETLRTVYLVLRNLLNRLGSYKPREGIRGEIDGLRALAVTLVLAYHAKFSFTGGYVGVDVFFVISGYLVTGTLLREIDKHGKIRIREFWARRIRRLLLPVTIVSISTLGIGYLLLEPFRLRSLAYDAVASATMNANNRFAVTTSDYLSGLTLPSPLLHLWSLAVEEQFYLLLPLLLLLALKFTSPRKVLALSFILLASLSLYLSIAITPNSPSYAYYLLPSRAWELLAGSGLALLGLTLQRIPSLLRSLTGWVGVAAIIFAATMYNERTPFPGYAALLPVLGTVAVIISGQLGPGRILANPILQWLGTRSYSLYLWHWPVLVLAEAKFAPLSAPTRLALLATSLLLADLTFRFAEQPFRFHPLLVARRAATFKAGTALTASLLGVSLLLTSVAPASTPLIPGVALAEDFTTLNQEESRINSTTDYYETPSQPTLPEPSPSPTLTSSNTNQLLPSPTPTKTKPLQTAKPLTPSSSNNSIQSTLSPKPTPTKPATTPSSASASAPPQTEAVSATSATTSPSPNSPVGKVLLIGDSTLAPLRWFKEGTKSLKGFDYKLEAESCRRLAYDSCKGREKRVPSSAAPVIKKLTDKKELYQTVVVMGGYHSTPTTIGPEFDLLVKAIRAHGATRIIFVEYRESLAYPAPGGKGKISVYTSFNKTIRARVATGKFPEVTLLPWNSYTASAGEWFRSDGIHVNLEGTLALGAYISDTLAALEGRSCVNSDTNEPCQLPAGRADRSIDLFNLYKVKRTDTHCYELGSTRKKSCMRDMVM